MPTRWWNGPLADLGVAGLATAIMLGAAIESGDVPSRPVDVVFVAAVVVIGAWSAVARRAPRTAMFGAALSLLGAFALGVPGFSPALALGYPLFMAARAGFVWWGVAVLAGIGAISVTARLVGAGAEPVGQVVFGTLADLTLLALVLSLGEVVRSRRALRAEADLRVQLAEQEHARRIAAHRLRTARDLHDVLAHTVTVVGIQAGVAAESLDDEPDRARRAIEAVRAATRDAMTDLRSTIAVLREDELHPAPRIAQLDELLDGARAAGLAATLSVRGDAGSPRPGVEVVVYRIVQESLTNVLRHARATAVSVSVRHGVDGVRVQVRDDGPGADAAPGRGSGLRGMAERVAALGGELSAGPAADGGYLVAAYLPVGGPP